VALAVVGGSARSQAQKDFDAADAIVSMGQKGELSSGVCDLRGPDYNIPACSAPRDDAQTRIDHAKTEQLVGFIGIGAGAAVLATGVVLLFTGESSHRFDPPGQSSKAHGPSWAFTPGPGQLGLGLVGAL
jgi:hypothetical protein